MGLPGDGEALPFKSWAIARGDFRIIFSAYQDVVDSTNNGLERALAYPEAKQQLKKG